jgi:branched-chain amino acid transport system substrate-binding protein
VSAPARRLGVAAIAAVGAAIVVAVVLLVGHENRSPAGPPAREVDSPACSPMTYGGMGGPSALIVLTVPLQGYFADHGIQAAQAAKLMLANRQWHAGDQSVGLQVCDEVSPGSDDSDPARCDRIARAAASNQSVLGVIGPWSTTCATTLLPALNRAPGPIAAISVLASYVGLTRAGPGVARGDPARFYPSERRNFARVVPADDVQAAAGVSYARQRGAHRLFVLHDATTYGRGLAEGVQASTELAQMDLTGSTAWRASAHDYRALGRRVRRAHADAVYLAGFVDNNGGRLVIDLRRALGPHVQLLGPDGFSDPRYLTAHAGSAAEDFVFTIATLPSHKLPPAGRRFATEFEQHFGALPCCISVQTAQAMEIFLDAIAASDGSRAEVTRNVLHAHVNDGLLGTFHFDAAGDTTGNTIAVYRITRGRGRFQTAFVPPTDLLARH